MKDKISEEAKVKEQEMKKLEEAKALLAKVPIKQIQNPNVKKVEGTGSVWNSNSYHWEEKSVAKWSD